MSLEATAVALAKSAGTVSLFKAAAERIERSLKGPAKALGIKALAALQGYSAYLAETNERVSMFKTFADPTKPVPLIDHFVETKFKVPRSKRAINQDDIIQKLKRPTRMVISATAGFGKSMVMRYIALSLYENPNGKIPVFLELRNLSRMSSPDIITYINASYRQSTAVQVESFRQSLASGAIVLLLDGFDELNHEIRREIENQILSIARQYPLTAMVISGRPDDRFKSWREFSIFKVLPMDQSQVIDLINKLEYDRGVRKRFIQKIKDGLFRTHESFMSTPLLAILMLLTFEQNANIPDKMHLFYSEAFRTLFHKHDALKEQYDRSRKSLLAVDEFEKVFSVFCLKTYVLEKLEFTEREILSYVKDALAYEGFEDKADDFLFDIEEAVCLFVKEGSSYFFVHRSFQEYFTALFLANCAEEIRNEFIEQVAVRYWDSVLPMLFDMASDQIVPSWVQPKCEKYLNEVGARPDQMSPLRARFEEIIFYKEGDGVSLSHFAFGPFWKFIAVMMRFYPDVERNTELNFGGIERWVRDNWKLASKYTVEAPSKTAQPGVQFVKVPIEVIPEAVLVASGLPALADGEYDHVKSIETGLDKEQRGKNEFLKKLFARA
jgi:hypothetical protein